MHVSLERRNIYELGEVHSRTYGLKAAEIPTTVKLNLSHNHLRNLQRPFAHSNQGDVRVAADTDTAVSSSLGTASAGASHLSLEEESSALRPFTSLTHLLVNHNQLCSLVGLCGAADTLTVLIATHNALTSVDGMQTCRRLTYVDLSYNSIESLQGLPLMLVAPSWEAASGNSPTAYNVLHKVASESAAELSHMGASALEGAALAAQLMAGGTAAKEDVELIFESVDGGDNESHTPIPTASIPISLQSSVGTETQQQPSGRSLGRARSLAARPSLSAGASAATGAHASSQPVAASAAADASPLLPGAKSGSGNIDSNKVGVVLILSHNRLRGRSLSGMVWVGSADAERAAAQGGTGSSTHLFLRPWCTALTHLDLSHNYIEDTRDVRRLFTPIPWPSSPSPSSAAAVTCAPALARLRCLDISGNPFLVNGSLADELARSMRTAVGNDDRSVVSSVQFRLNYASRTLSAALRGPSPSASAVGFPSLAAAQRAMDALLTSLADRWQCTAPSSSAPATTSMFSLFSPADARAAVEKAPQPCTVHLRGGELTVLAAALQQRGARLGEMLEVPALAPGLYAKRAAASPTPNTAGSGHSPPPSGHSRNGGDAHTAVAMAADADAPRAIFLTPPPRWTRDTSIGVDASVLSGGGAPSPPAAQQPTTRMAPSSAPPTPPRAATVEAPQDAPSTSSSSSRAETSTVGYRLYQGRGHQRQPGPVVDKSAENTGAAVAHLDVTAGSGAAAVSHTSTVSLSADAVELQLLHAEVVELRRRHRELQRQTHDQTRVLQRQEATIRELKKAAALAQQEAQAELSKAQLEIQRLHQRVQILNDLAAQAAPPQPTSVSPTLSVPLQLPPSGNL
ncbi:hypothetical protein, unknown function [Leishmania mexicana MHOM/GT/2001/U1103]|uniref:Leucine-rich repeat protein n=1 Tax=Leishmania mexicana (strain MHOM/GT/2001/U1103) TaxID=929439 RepID=E9AKM2_LEIMU|nr:hypothetical protein, unknown function [Leishmania mexicana MHOM/GT/2001/U1103]CBZ23473.1 hypothetical protein, unknown function [Leishmania mexicana MHOM/GT/2001/U1103]